MNIARAKEILKKFADQKILVVGDVVLDRYVSGSVERINPEAPVPILHAHKEHSETGGAGNVAKNIAKLGAKAELLSITGDDDLAEVVAKQAHVEGYIPKLIPDPSRPTTLKVRYIAQSQQMLRVDYEKTHEPGAGTEQQIIDLIEEYSKACDGIIVSDYAKGVITEKIAAKLLTTAKKQSIPLAIDVKPSRAPWFKGATFISPNLKEARQFLGMAPFEHDGKSFAELAEALYKKMEADIFITLSAQGIYIKSRKGIAKHLPQPHVPQVADTSGGGDSAIATILLSLLSGATDLEAAELANAAGAVVVSKIGAVGVTQDEVLTMLSNS